MQYVYGGREGSQGGGEYDDSPGAEMLVLHTPKSLCRLKHRDMAAVESQQPQQLAPPELRGDVSDTLGSVADKTKAGDLRAACRLL